MKIISFLTLSALISISACSHHKKSCCAQKESCSRQEKKSCDKAEKKECKEGSCAKKAAPAS